MAEDFNKSIKRQRDDYNKQMGDLATDFKRQMERSQQDFATGMSRLEEQYQTSLARAQEDYQETMRAMNGFYEEAARNTMGDIESATNQFNAKILAGVDTTIEQLKKKNPKLISAFEEAGLEWLIGIDNGLGGGGGGKGGGSGPSGGGGTGVENPKSEVRNFVLGSGAYSSPPANSEVYGAPQPWNSGRNAKNTQELLSVIKKIFPQVTSASGFARRDGVGYKSDHPVGKAVDISWNNPRSYGGLGIGNMIANFFSKNPYMFGTKGIIWNRQVNYGHKGGWQTYNPPGTFGDYAHLRHVHVSLVRRGGVISRPHLAYFGEFGPETVLPLDQRGADVLADVMRRYLSASEVRKMLTLGSSPVGSQVEINNYDNKTVISGEITVKANDPNEMARQLRAKQRMEALNKSSSVIGS